MLGAVLVVAIAVHAAPILNTGHIRVAVGMVESASSIGGIPVGVEVDVPDEVRCHDRRDGRTATRELPHTKIPYARLDGL